MPRSDASASKPRCHLEWTYPSLRVGIAAVHVVHVVAASTFACPATGSVFRAADTLLPVRDTRRAASRRIVAPSPGLECAAVPGRLARTAPLDQSVEERRTELARGRTDAAKSPA